MECPAQSSEPTADAVVIWLVEMSLMGAATSVVDSFLFDLTASTLLCGLTVRGHCPFLEIPIIACSKSLLANIGHDCLLVTSMFAYAIRVIGLPILPLFRCEL